MDASIEQAPLELAEELSLYRIAVMDAVKGLIEISKNPRLAYPAYTKNRLTLAADELLEAVGTLSMVESFLAGVVSATARSNREEIERELNASPSHRRARTKRAA